MGRQGLWVVGAVVLVAIVLWVVARDRRPAAEDAPPVEPSPSAAPESERDPGRAAERPTKPGTAESPMPGSQAAPAALPSQAPAAPQPAEELAPMPAPERSGPVAELKQAFENQPRDSAARLPESRIESEFRKSDVAPGLLKSVLCRESVCKVEVLWTPERAIAYMSAFTRLSADFEPDIAIDPQAAADGRPELQVDVYLPRRAPGAKPSAR